MTKPIDEFRSISYDKFVVDYLVPRCPVVIRDAAANMPAMRWSYEWLSEHFGDKPIRFDIGNEWNGSTLGQFLENLSPSSGYLRNQSLIETIPELLKDVSIPEYCLPNWFTSPPLRDFVPSTWSTWVELFISAAGVRFPTVHIDVSLTHAWVAGVRGIKRFWAWPPEKSFRGMSIHSHDDLRQMVRSCKTFDPDSLFEHSKPLIGNIGPGDLLFLPTAWWHTAESITDTITLSGNFVNETNWEDFAASYFTGLHHVCSLPRLNGRPDTRQPIDSRTEVGRFICSLIERGKDGADQIL